MAVLDLREPVRRVALWMCLGALLAPSVRAADDEKETPRGAHAASECREAPRCPLFDEVYAHTPAFRHALSLSLRHGDEAVPEWVKDRLPGHGPPPDQPRPPTTATPMLPLRIDDRPYLLGHMSDPQNPRHRLVALYDTQRGLAAVDYVNADAKAARLGDDAEILRKVIDDYLRPESDFARSLARPDVALPVPVRSH
ncbi:hypothetical protein [Variovorax sp.]|uniref:hypothetical protein n=1 Tax=Variovorax sp. TaxID=1871043 RepID=UPI002D504760|nr:hypothetical protein [Variovorax sp.]HYP83039.1 hypothetical protein [Variovorax sp.]